MALQFMDGLDLYTGTSDMLMQWAQCNCAFTTTGGRFGGCAIYNTSYNEYATVAVPTPVNEIWVGFAVNVTSTGSEQPVAGFKSSNGLEWSLEYTPNTTSFRVSRGGTTLGSASGSLNGAWHWLEIHSKLGNGTGAIEVWLDGNQIINLSNIDNVNSGGSTHAAVLISSDNTNNATAGLYDDIYVLDTTGSAPYNSRLGDCRIETLLPNGDAGPNNGTPLSGSNHYAMVDATNNDGGSDYITLTNTSGQTEMFDVASLSGAPATVLAVKVTCMAKKTDAGLCDGEAVITSGGTTATGASAGLTTSYGVVSGIFLEDPNTSAPWLYTAVNAASVGFQVP